MIVSGDGVKVCTTVAPPPADDRSVVHEHRVLAAVPAGSTITDFGCSGEWAWAGIDVSADQGGYEATELLKAAGNGWTDRRSDEVLRAGERHPGRHLRPGVYHQLTRWGRSALEVLVEVLGHRLGLGLGDAARGRGGAGAPRGPAGSPRRG